MKTTMSDSLNPSSPKIQTIATPNHSPRSVEASSTSQRRLWQSPFQRLWNRETPKDHENMMLKAGERGSIPLFQGAERIERKVFVKLSFVLLNEFEFHFRLFFQVAEEM